MFANLQSSSWLPLFAHCHFLSRYEHQLLMSGTAWNQWQRVNCTTCVYLLRNGQSFVKTLLHSDASSQNSTGYLLIQDSSKKWISLIRWNPVFWYLIIWMLLCPLWCESTIGIYFSNFFFHFPHERQILNLVVIQNTKLHSPLYKSFGLSVCSERDFSTEVVSRSLRAGKAI